MNFIEKSIVVMLVFFGLASATNLDAQTSRVWDDRYVAVDDLGANFKALAAGIDNGLDAQGNYNGIDPVTGAQQSLTQQEAVVLNGAYWTLMQYIDDAEDTEQGYLNWEARVDQEAQRDTGGDYAQDVQRLKDHMLSLISTQ